MSTYSAAALAAERPRPIDWFLGSLWVADTLGLGMLAFFMVTGGVNPAETGGFAVVLAFMAGLLWLNLWQMRRARVELQRSRSSRRARERRGF